MSFASAAVLLLVASSSPESPVATAQSPAPAPEFTTVVTASRSVERLDETAVAVEVITRRELEATGARNVAEALSAHPAIEIRESYAGSELWLQGLAPEYTLVLVDGERVTGRLGGALDLSRLAADEVEQIEIVRGPSSVTYGSDAVAGVINVITRRAQRTLGAQAQLSYGTQSQLELHGSAGARRESWRLRVSGGLQSRDPYDLSPDSLSTTGSSLQGFDLGLRGDVQLREGARLDASLESARQLQRGIDEGAGGATFDRASQHQSHAATLSLTLGAPDSQLSVTARGSLFRHRFVMDQRSASALDKLEDTEERLGRLGVQWERQLATTHRLTAGIEGVGEALDSDRLGTPGSRLRLSGYAQDTWTLPLRAQLVPGLRLDRDSQFGWALSPRLALRLDPLDNLTLRASYGWAFRAPGFSEQLIDFENPSVGYAVQGNPELRAERSRGLNLTAELRPASRTLLWAHLFRNDLTDMISVVQERSPEGTRYSYANLERATVQGLELGVRQGVARGFNLGLGYTFTDARDLGADRKIEGQSPHRLTAQVDFRFRPLRLDAAAQVAVVGQRPFYEPDPLTGAEQRVLAAPYATLNARIAHAIHARLQLFVNGRNLLGAGDPDFLPVPPRSFFAGLAATL